jgi:glycine/D-amino acid oxidase-like deaminating enzyme
VRLSRDDLERRFPQMVPKDATWGLLEEGGGVIMARRAVELVVRAAVRLGAVYRHAQVKAPVDAGLFGNVSTQAGDRLVAEQFVFACGSWLPALFPAVIGERIRPTRQEVFFFGVPAGDDRFRPPNLPVWLHFKAGIYGLPDIDNRGLKIAMDEHGPSIDPERADRTVPPERIDAMRTTLTERFPALAGAPLLETRVCQYENTWNGDLLVDRHPTFRNVWIVGGGSGHGFKHGPAVGEYVADRLSGAGRIEPRFSLASKTLGRARSVY